MCCLLFLSPTLDGDKVGQMSMVGWMYRVSRSPEFTDITLGRNLGTSTLILSSGALWCFWVAPCARGASGGSSARHLRSISLHTSRWIASFKVKDQREMPQCHFLFKKNSTAFCEDLPTFCGFPIASF
jgi:hypothetical protein